ncbi:hypothetical protein [Cognatiyoonia sp. IB215182]|uniref:hypothetical protein n=1 Tax=Cognatiyoonia sp. IB215182 TaxID=3097353 RepID=UPI002A0DA6DD|nr:hypothetical protein [Cognatiyoonia sp. IB215182]MDX8351879.1 hypothetical protein [Cognatiyoonia sp. IB215182]
MKLEDTRMERWIDQVLANRFVHLFWIGMLAFGVLAQLYSNGVVLDMRIEDDLPQLMFRDNPAHDTALADKRYGWVVVGWFEYYLHRFSTLWFHVCFFGFAFMFLLKFLAAKLPEYIAAFKQGREEGR